MPYSTCLASIALQAESKETRSNTNGCTPLKETTTGQELVLEGRPIDLTFIELSKVRKRLDIAPRGMTRLERWLVFLAADLDTALDALRDQQGILIDALLIAQKERP